MVRVSGRMEGMIDELASPDAADDSADAAIDPSGWSDNQPSKMKDVSESRSGERDHVRKRKASLRVAAGRVCMQQGKPIWRCFSVKTEGTRDVTIRRGEMKGQKKAVPNTIITCRFCGWFSFYSSKVGRTRRPRMPPHMPPHMPPSPPPAADVMY